MENRHLPLLPWNGGGLHPYVSRLALPEEDDDTDHCNACRSADSGVCPMHAGERWFVSPLDDIDELAAEEDAI